MADDSQVHKTGENTPLTNTPLDAPTILIDGVQGAMISAHLAKINLIEDLLDPDGHTMKRRFVAVLAMPRDQLQKIGELLVKMGGAAVPNEDA